MIFLLLIFFQIIKEVAFSKFNINRILNEPNNLQQFKKEFILYNEFVFDYIEKIHVKDLSVIRTIF